MVKSLRYEQNWAILADSCGLAQTTQRGCRA